MAGHVDKHFMSDVHFNQMTRSFTAKGVTMDPDGMKQVGIAASSSSSNEPRDLKRHKGGSADQVDSWLGPWAGFVKDDPTPLQESGLNYKPGIIFDSSNLTEEKVLETSTFHGKEERDYLVSGGEIGNKNRGVLFSILQGI
jgi:hypothetical protein